MVCVSICIHAKKKKRSPRLLVPAAPSADDTTLQRLLGDGASVSCAWPEHSRATSHNFCGLRHVIGKTRRVIANTARRYS